jgi:hypothetical protein
MIAEGSPVANSWWSGQALGSSHEPNYSSGPLKGGEYFFSPHGLSPKPLTLSGSR